MKEKYPGSISRRRFIHQSTAMGAFPFLNPFNPNEPTTGDWTDGKKQAASQEDSYVQRLDLSPARWLWYPSQRCLSNSFVLFRRELQIAKAVGSAKGWILGDSRYKLYLDGSRIQFGPAPSDPRYSEADPVDLSDHLSEGNHVIGAEVLYYGLGDGTWPIGKPGFIFRLDIEYLDGTAEQIISNGDWKAHLCRAWPPGKHKRWYLRALQEDFDARKYPVGWGLPVYQPNAHWLPAMELSKAADQTALATPFRDYLLESSGQATQTQLRKRTIPMLMEERIPVKALVNSFYIRWIRPPEEYFECLPPQAYEAIDQVSAVATGDQSWRVDLDEGQAAILTFELTEQIVGFPYFMIDAPEGTVIELLVQEGHDPEGRIVMNNHFHAWSRFTCQEGQNYFECFDFESLRWMQLHIRQTDRPVIVTSPGVRRRQYPWPESPKLYCSDLAIQRLWDAAINTLHNAGQETIVDGMGRERQQYSGDIGHALHAIFYTFGDTRLPARFVHTFSQGLTKDGYFLDCWPAYDRLARLSERQLDLTPWGPLLDHSLGFNFDCYHYYLYTGELEPLREVYPRLLVFASYLENMRDESGILPVEDIGVPWVWMDNRYPEQRYKQCAFNLYAVAALEYALAPLAKAFGDEVSAGRALQLAQDLLKRTQHFFWDDGEEVFVINKPWLKEDGQARYCDRSLSMALLFDQCPKEKNTEALKILVDPPSSLIPSYPANAGWRMWALAQEGRIDQVLEEWRGQWTNMASVIFNKTIQEDWDVQPDSNSQWSHLPVAPLYLAFMGIAGLKPLSAGFERMLIRPQPGDLESVDLVAHTVKGRVYFQSEGRPGQRKISIRLPEGVEGVLALPESETVKLPIVEGLEKRGLKYYLIPEKGIDLDLGI